MNVKPNSIKPRIPALLAIITVASLFTFTACSPFKPLKGGHAATSPTAGGLQQSIAQGDNASQPTRQDQEIVKVRSYTLPAGSRLEQLSASSMMPRRAAVETDPSLASSNTPSLFVVLSSPMPVTEREEARAKTELGAAQRDTGREFGAKLASLRGITWAGVVLFVFGLGSLVWPPLKAIIGSVTTSAAITFGGLALIILPTLIVGNELLILGAVALSVIAWFLAHRHGQLRGELSALDLNPNRNRNRNLPLPSSSPPQATPAQLRPKI